MTNQQKEAMLELYNSLLVDIPDEHDFILADFFLISGVNTVKEVEQAISRVESMKSSSVIDNVQKMAMNLAHFVKHGKGISVESHCAYEEILNRRYESGDDEADAEQFYLDYLALMCSINLVDSPTAKLKFYHRFTSELSLRINRILKAPVGSLPYTLETIRYYVWFNYLYVDMPFTNGAKRTSDSNKIYYQHLHDRTKDLDVVFKDLAQTHHVGAATTLMSLADYVPLFISDKDKDTQFHGGILKTV